MGVKSFGGSKMMMEYIDPRLIHYNSVSRFPGELKFLPLLTLFPDEMAGFWVQEHCGGVDKKDHLKSPLCQKGQAEYGKAKAKNRIKLFWW